MRLIVALSNDSAVLPLELICFGPPAAHLPGRLSPPELRWRKHIAFLVYLALSPNRTRSRQHLLGMLWPEKDEHQARHSLNEAVRRLRGCLGESRIVSEGDLLTLNADALDVDAGRFEALAATKPGEAVAILTGDFLEGFSAGTAPAFDDWVADTRERYRSAGADLLMGEASEALLRSSPRPGALLGAGRAPGHARPGSRGRRTSPYWIGGRTFHRARLAAILGDRDRAVELYRQALDQGWVRHAYDGFGVHSDPDFESLRDYLPFQELTRPKD